MTQRNNSSGTMINFDIHKHFVWIYGVIAGFAIREALGTVIPHLTTNMPMPVWAYFQEGIRLLVFLLIVIRLYFGTVLFFEVGNSDTSAQERNIVIPYLVGLVQFIFCFVWAASIDTQNKPRRLFLLMLMIILLYDLVGFWSSHSQIRNLTKLWTIINAMAVMIGLSIYLIAITSGANPVLAEEIALIPVLCVNIIDIAELANG